VPKFSVPVRGLTVTVVVAMLATILTTYTLCVHKDECPKLPHLPTISNTWTHPPGNYLSRFVVGNVAMLMGVIQYAIYQINSKPGKSKRTFISNETLLHVGFWSCVLLSFVGAVCDDKDLPSCRGNNTVHSICAVSFFICYDAIMVINVLEHRASLTQKICAFLSVLCKLRWLPPVILSASGLGDQTLLAIFEWCDVATIMAWTAAKVFPDASTYRFGIVDNAAPGNGETTVYKSFSTTWIANLVYTMLIATLVSTLAFGVYENRIPQGTVPMISDLFVYAPGDWISRWGLVAGGTLSAGNHVAVYFMGRGQTASVMDAAVTVTACIAMLGLSIVGCVNETENNFVHTVAAVIFFGLYDVVMIMSPVNALLKRTKGFPWVRVCVYIVVSLVSKARFFPQSLSELGLGGNIVPILEWSDAIVLTCFFKTFMAFNDNSHQYSFSFFSESSQSSSKPLLASDFASVTREV